MTRYIQDTSLILHIHDFLFYILYISCALQTISFSISIISGILKGKLIHISTCHLISNICIKFHSLPNGNCL